MMPNKVSVVLPTYNESGHIVDLVKNVIDNIPSGWEYEIFVVDDNSPDHTHDVVTNAFVTIPRLSPFSALSTAGSPSPSAPVSNGPAEIK